MRQVLCTAVALAICVCTSTSTAQAEPLDFYFSKDVAAREAHFKRKVMMLWKGGFIPSDWPDWEGTLIAQEKAGFNCVYQALVTRSQAYREHNHPYFEKDCRLVPIEELEAGVTSETYDHMSEYDSWNPDL